MSAPSKIARPLPWQFVRLGDVARTMTGGTPRRDKPSYYGGPIPWVKSGELRDGIVYDTEEALTKEGLESSNAKIFPKGTLCIALYGATVGKLGILGIDASTNQAICGIFPSKEIDTRYLFRFLEGQRRYLVEQGKGGAQSNISQGIIRDTTVPLPPIAEQRRIVAEIEKQFTRWDAGVAALKRVQANLKRYRAAVLKAACEGRLVPTEAELHRAGNAPDFESGADLLRRILVERRKRWNGRAKYKEPALADRASLSELPEGWTWAPLESITDAIGGYAFESKKFCDSGYQVVKMANVRMGRLDLNNRPSYISDVPRQIVDKFRLKSGDVLITLTGTRKERDYGCVAAVKHEEKLLLNQRIARVRPFDGLIPTYLEIAMQSESYRNRFFAYETGNVGQGNVGIRAVTFEPIALPPLAEQKRIATEVDRRLSVVEELESVVAANLHRTSRLRDSILQKAFTGALTEQDP
jgi:type I restriction enzyme, S subunit